MTFVSQHVSVRYLAGTCEATAFPSMGGDFAIWQVPHWGDGDARGISTEFHRMSTAPVDTEGVRDASQPRSDVPAGH